VFSHAPTAGRVTAGFGPRNDPFSGALAFHAGVDIAAPLGTPVVAPAAGRVTRIVLGHEGYGDMIEVDHGGGYRLRYAQLSRIDVREGESVSAGQQIGGVGNSGRATGTHLHFEVWRDGVPLDPATVAPLQ
jgi:murein DD-endopeptidase MepM/ murein hydrolase activator NlpD